MNAPVKKRTPFEKRVRRHLVGPPQRFFATAPPGLEELLREELLQVCPALTDLVAIPGGVEGRGKIHDLMAANLFSRIAGRILMRITEFRATNFRRFEEMVARVPWELYLPVGRIPEVQVTTHKSRLYHSDALAERTQSILGRTLPSTPAGIGTRPEDEPLPQTDLFIRGVEDHFTVSIDGSGEPLFKRGLKALGGRAPLRETLAATILRLCGYDGTRPLVDPLCGTGSFSLEAALIAKRIPPGWFRRFAFEGWPAFSKKRWAFVRREAQREFASPPDQPLIFASDRDPEATDLVERTAADNCLSETIDVRTCDLFEVNPPPNLEPGLIVLNPPYGQRLGTPEASIRFIREIGASLREKFPGWSFGLLAPKEGAKAFKGSNCRTHRLHHGGLILTLVVGKLPVK